MKDKIALPELPFSEWKDTRITLHLILQIIGKTRLKLTARKNHWWYITIYVTSKGFGTHGIPINDGLESLEIELNLAKKAVILYNSNGKEVTIPLEGKPTIGEFYKRFMNELNRFDLHPEFIEKPLDLGIEKRFDEIFEYNYYSWSHLNRFWKLMLWNKYIFQEFSGRFYGKTCPPHIYWHHMDLTITRFSGKRLPPMDKSASILERDAYSHEQISFGFWAGDENVPEPMYYSYTHPSPNDLDKEPLSFGANWIDSNGSPMALLSYENVRNSNDPRKAVLDFLESAYQAGAKKANWPIDDFKVPPLSDV